MADLNTLLISAEFDEKCTELVMPRIGDQILILPPTRQLLDFLASATQPRMETEEFVFYSFEADCLKIVTELQKIGFEIVSMNYLPAASTSMGSSSALSALSSSSNVDVAMPEQDVLKHSETSAEPPAIPKSATNLKLSAAEKMTGNTAGARMWNHEIEFNTRQREKVIWLLLATADDAEKV